MEIVLTAASILALTALAYAVRRVAWPRLCPLCAGVAGTWLGLLAAHGAGFPVDLRLPAVLLGGSVVGLAGALGARLPIAGEGGRLAWKTAFVAAGFAAAAALVMGRWGGSALGLAALAALAACPWVWAWWRAPGADPVQVERLKAEMKSCC